MRKIDRFLLVSFIPPFLVTFGIATFALLMQILWVYIDDIAGKGLGMFMIIELLSYKAVGLVPMALPLAILISSVMVLGGLAERYELSSMKSAGISLLRIMRPLVFFGFVSMFVSYLFNDYVIPAANLQFGSRMYDISQKKPTLNMEEGIFNDDFGDYAIRIGKKGKDGSSINDILIYDHTDANSGILTSVVADSGQMYTTPAGDFFIMQLHNGHQYIETRPSTGRGQGQTTPFIRTSFKSWNKVFDMGEFDLSQTNQELFSMNRSMMTISQLSERVDTIQKQIDQRYYSLARQVSGNFSVLEPDSLYPQTVLEDITLQQAQDSASNQPPYRDSLPVYQPADSVPPKPMALPSTLLQDTARLKRIAAAKRLKEERSALAAKAKPPLKDTVINPLLPIERFTDTIPTVEAWLASLNKTERQRLITKAKSSARSIKNQAEQAVVSIDRTKEEKVKHVYELYTKYSMAVVCIVFVFIGAPLGAIVRKGGFGYPLLVSVVAFIVFVVLTIFCRKIAETFIVPAALAAWLPCIVLSPIGIWLTAKAMADSKLFEWDGIAVLFSKRRRKNK
ncbi:MAG: LptF/LptG family permease [Saprospiraceae bacterium]